MPSTWNGDSFFEGIRQQVSNGVGAASQTLKTKAKQLISIQGPPRSKPGESPHKDTGRLYASIEAIGPAQQGDLIIASVGTSVRYGLYLEYGTSRMAARPWLSRSLLDNQAVLGKQIVGGK